MIFQIILTFHILIAVALIAIILMQQGKGANMGAAFGSGASGTVFGAGGANSFLYKLTRGLAIGFFATSVTLAHIASSDNKSSESATSSIITESDISTVPAVETPTATKGIPE